MGLLDKMWNRFHVDIFIKAVRFGDEPQVISMLQREPDLAYIKDAKGISALFHAVANGYTRIAKQILRITKQANDVDPEKGFTPLLIAATNGHVGLVKLLLEYGADPNMRNFDGVTALHNAIFEEQVDIVKLLLQHDADPNIRDRVGNTPMDLAKRSSNNEIRSLL